MEAKKDVEFDEPEFDDDATDAAPVIEIAAPTRGTRGSNRAEDVVPGAIIEALTDTAWSLPRLRVSFGRVLDARTLRFVACAHGGPWPPLAGTEVRLDRAPKLRQALYTTEEVLGFEDCETDRRTRPVSAELLGAGVRSMALLPVRSHGSRLLDGVVSVDAPTPRSWGRHEVFALERLAPLVALALGTAVLTDALNRTDSELAVCSRRLAAVQGSLSTHGHDARRIFGALTECNDPLTRRQLVRMLEDLLYEFEDIAHGRGPERDAKTVDLGVMFTSSQPGLHRLCGRPIRVRTSPGAPRVRGVRHGLLRLFVNLLGVPPTAPDAQRTVAKLTLRNQGNDVVVRVVDPGGSTAAIAAQTAFSGPGADNSSTAVFQARTELLLHRGSIAVLDPSTVELRLPRAPD